MEVAIVTGATGGMGRWIALGLTRAGYHVILMGRDPARTEAAELWIKSHLPQSSTEMVVADLSLIGATRDAGKTIMAKHPKIRVLVNNAGIFDTRRVLTTEGRERVLATNLLCPILLSAILLPALRSGAPSRIINIGSSTSDRAHLDAQRLELGSRWTMTQAYSQSKLALMMATFALAKRLEGSGVDAYVVHPGLVATGLVRAGGIIGFVWRCLSLLALTEQQGADTALHAALNPQFAGVSGVYIKDRRCAKPNPQALDPTQLELVWKATEQLTGPLDGEAA
jgi:NAD(P)-dependent dehydrogenase (short-subunit alcohol dehydrogenase family)